LFFIGTLSDIQRFSTDVTFTKYGTEDSTLFAFDDKRKRKTREKRSVIDTYIGGQKISFFPIDPNDLSRMYLLRDKDVMRLRRSTMVLNSCTNMNIISSKLIRYYTFSNAAVSFDFSPL
jgi:hypothetical protein